MLRRMSRKVTRAETESLLDRLRTRIPELVLRTTFITGFPGETDEQFTELVEFIQQQRFERMGVFTYSFESDTPSANLPDHLPEAVKQERREQLMAVQQQIAFEHSAARVGRQIDVILDQRVEDAENAWFGRSHADAPDVDAVVYVTEDDLPLKAGTITACELVASQGYDLVGVAVPPAS